MEDRMVVREEYHCLAICSRIHWETTTFICGNLHSNPRVKGSSITHTVQ